jgi:hypothetical protein
MRVYGSVNGQAMSASPDTGSDVDIITKGLAKFLGLEICSNPDAIETIQFVDGSCVKIWGIARDVEWQFGRRPKNPSVKSSSPTSHPRPSRHCSGTMVQTRLLTTSTLSTSM